MIDTHSHLNFKAFKDDYAQVIERSFNNGIKFIINVGSQFETSKKAIELADSYKNLYATVGLHPIHVKDEKFSFETYKKLTQNKKVVAVGETGLDYFHIKEKKLINLQKEIFLSHIKLAQELDLPLILHCRDSKEEPNKAYEEMLEILKKEKIKKGVIHCFSATLQIAQRFLTMGFYLGFTGIITFAEELEEVVKEVSLERILTETDCPYLAPVPYRGQRCEPWYVKFVIEKIAKTKNISYNKVLEQTAKNAVELFKLSV